MFTIDDWSEYDKKINLSDLRSLSLKSDEKSINVELGTYTVKIKSMILGVSRSGNKMFKGTFEIVDGDSAGKVIYMNQVLNYRFQINSLNIFLHSLNCGVDVYFESFPQYRTLINKAFASVNGRFLYRLYYGCDTKGFSIFKITNVLKI